VAVDFSTDLGKVRALIPDTEEVDWEGDGEASYIFPDDHLQALLDIYSGSVKRAASSAIGAIAVSEALISKVIKTEDLQTDGSKVAQALRARANDLWDQAEEDDAAEGEAFFEVVPFYPRPPLCGPR